MAVSGVLAVDKPADWTSQDVVAKLRGVFHTKRIGHGGTLDPMATGVLPILVGKATKAADFVTQGRKTYHAVLQLGVATDTQDTTGNVVKTSPIPENPGEKLRELLPQFTGEIFQLPPMYSAIKRQGKKLYELARKGVEVEREPRKITIFDLALTPGDTPDTFGLKVTCSKGTYIRTLCHDLGQALGCGGCMAALRRVQVGQFTLDAAISLEELVAAQGPERYLKPVDGCFDYPRLRLTGLPLKRALCGNPFPTQVPPGDYRVYDENGNFLLLGRCDGRECRIIKSFYEVDER